MRVGGRVVADPAAAVMRYLSGHDGTVAHYDLFPGRRVAVGLDLIRATRSPWMNSRISATHADWFIDRAQSAPWSKVPLGAELADADPIDAEGLYDMAEELFDHFFSTRPRWVNVGKISKVLHLMRPRLYPILDTELTCLYRSAAREAAVVLAQSRAGFARHRRLYWAAIRQDILTNSSALEELRGLLRESGVKHAAAVAAEVGDVRLLDMMAWDASG